MAVTERSKQTRSVPTKSAGVRWGCSASLALLGLMGCSAGEPCVGGSCPEDQVEVATWWATRGELYEPFEVLRQSLRRSTGLEVGLAHQLENKDGHTKWVEKQLLGLSPERLDVFSANNGDEVMRWIPCGRSGSGSGVGSGSPKLHALNDPSLGLTHLRSDWMGSAFPERVMETLECKGGGDVYALPVGIHRINSLFYNKALFGAAGYAVDGTTDGTPLPRSLDELRSAAERVALELPPGDPGSQLQPSAFAVSGREDWTLSLFFIENVMLSLASGAEQYEDYWKGTRCDEGLLRRALAEVSRLKPYFGSWELDSRDALQRVKDGQAAMMVIGDWARGEVQEELVGSIPFPGTAQYFVFTADVFALPAISSADPKKGLAWLRAVSGAQTQLDFSEKKHALPGRSDLGEGPASEAGVEPTWVRSLPGFLPYGEDVAFAKLQLQLRRWLNAQVTDDEVARYAREEYWKLPDLGMACPDDADPTVPE
jgi:glucose/mannose transport system substrate-binding protein